MNATGQVNVVVLTHNRVSELARTLHRLEGLADVAHIVVVDNASTDGTGTHVQRHFPRVELVHCEKNLGAAARNLGVACVDTPYVAFCDDDTWWAEGSLHKACALLARHPHLAAVAARVLVGEREVVDPTCERMAASPLPPAGLPGLRLAAFMAGAVVMRTDAYREVGGYDERLFLGAEEALMALDLLVLGWQMMYSHKVVVHHHPSSARGGPAPRDAAAQPVVDRVAAPALCRCRCAHAHPAARSCSPWRARALRGGVGARAGLGAATPPRGAARRA